MLVILAKKYNEPKDIVGICVKQTAQIHQLAETEVIKILMENVRQDKAQAAVKMTCTIPGPIIYNNFTIKIARKVTRNTNENVGVDTMLRDYYKKYADKRWAINKNSTVRQYQPFTERAQKFEGTPLTFVDIGCGDGEALVLIGKQIKATRVICCDVEDVRTNKTSEFVLVSVNTPLMFADNSVQIVSIFHTLHHMIDAEFRLRDIARILASGGLLFVKDHDVVTPEDSQNVTFEHFAYSIGEGKATLRNKHDYNTIEPMYYYSEEQVTKYLEHIGFVRIYLYKYTNATKTYNAIYEKM